MQDFIDMMAEMIADQTNGKPRQPPTVREYALCIARNYSIQYGEDPPRKWQDWNETARDDFWDSAQHDFKIPAGDRIPTPEDLRED